MWGDTSATVFTLAEPHTQITTIDATVLNTALTSASNAAGNDSNPLPAVTTNSLSPGRNRRCVKLKLASQPAQNTGQVTYSYPGTGTVTETNAAGNSTTLIFEANGDLAENKDSLGNVTKYQYNSSNELAGVVMPTGATYTFSYDADGNLTGYTDPDGGSVSTAYAPGTDLLTSFTDQDGNKTNYRATCKIVATR
jgi:YD repeat-containing protein